ncbi:hypothetical protein RF11_02704 [Thelohanellus kitauei]|uniref:Uncharacterized protein n=1 Tax=Thelohanellus kitauei TaxID=669202 RepID=A0A0C2IIW3_THEKT|nr:hypothetical protein RF11_02704 [Thelohanellus kitauei]
MSKVQGNQDPLRKYNDMIDAIRTLLRSRYEEIEFFDINDLNSDDVKLLTVIKLCVDNYSKIKDAYRELQSLAADPRTVLEQHEILIDDIIKFGSDVEELIHDTDDINTVKQFSNSFNYILEFLVEGIRRILPDPSFNVALVNKINQTKQKHTISSGEMVNKFIGTMESREVYLRKLEQVLNTSINPILTYILFDPFKKPPSIPTEDYKLPHVDMGSQQHKYLSEIELGINTFLLKLQKDGRFKYAQSLKWNFDLNVKLQSDYDDISEGVERLLALIHGEEFNGQTLMDKLQIIANQVLDTPLSDSVTKSDETELLISQDELKKYVNFVIQKLEVARQKCSVLSGVDSDIIVTINTIVTSFKTILMEFSRTPLEIGEEMKKKLDDGLSDFIKNLDKSTTSLLNKFKKLHETIMGFEKKDFKNNVEIEEFKTAQLIMLNKIQELQGEIANKSQSQENRDHMVRIKNIAADVCERVIKYSTDLLTYGLKMRGSLRRPRKLSTSDGEFDADNTDVDDMPNLTDEYFDEIPDIIQDQKLAIEVAESTETSRISQKMQVDLFSKIKRLEKYESEDIRRNAKIADLIKFLTIYSQTVDIKTGDPITTSEHPMLGESSSLNSKDIIGLYKTVIVGNDHNMGDLKTLNENRAEDIVYAGMEESKSISKEIQPGIIKNIDNLPNISNNLLQLNTTIFASKKAMDDSIDARNRQLDSFIPFLSIYSANQNDPDRLKPQIDMLDLKSLSDSSKQTIQFNKSISDSLNNLYEHERSVDTITKKFLKDTQLFSTQNKQDRIKTVYMTSSDIENLLECIISLKSLNEQVFKSRSISEKIVEFRNEKIKNILEASLLISLNPKSHEEFRRDLNNYSVFESLLETSSNSINLHSSLLDSNNFYNIQANFSMDDEISHLLRTMTLYSQQHNSENILRISKALVDLDNDILKVLDQNFVLFDNIVESKQKLNECKTSRNESIDQLIKSKILQTKLKDKSLSISNKKMGRLHRSIYLPIIRKLKKTTRNSMVINTDLLDSRKNTEKTHSQIATLIDQELRDFELYSRMEIKNTDFSS